MKNRGKSLSIILMMILVLTVGCSAKEETKMYSSAAKQEEVVDITQGAEVSKTAPTVDEEIIVEEASMGEDINYIQIHSIILDKIYSWIVDGTEGIHVAEGEQAIVDAIEELGRDNAIYDMGYLIEELNNDGIPELIIGETTQTGKGNMIYAIYTWKDGNFQCNVENAEYVQVFPGSINEAQELYMTPFAYYDLGGANLEYNTDEVVAEEPPVCVQWIDDVYLEPNGYDVFTADENAEQRQVVFIAISKVSDFRVLSLSFEGVSENGSMVQFATSKLYGQEELKPERPLMVGMSCESSIPCYGISYVDENGVTRRFAIEVSGMDGSVLLSEF